MFFFPLFFFFPLLLPPPPFFNLFLKLFLRNLNTHPVCWIFAWLCIPPCLKQLPSAPLARLTLQSTVNIPVEVKNAARGRRRSAEAERGCYSRIPSTATLPASTHLRSLRFYMFLKHQIPFPSSGASLIPIPALVRKIRCQQNHSFRCFFLFHGQLLKVQTVFSTFPIPGTSPYVPCRDTLVPSHPLCLRRKKYGYWKYFARMKV